MSPRVAIDARMARHAGIGTYIRNLVPRIVARRPDWEFTIVLGGAQDDSSEPPFEFAEDDGARVRYVRARSDIYSLRQQIELPRLARADLWWSPHYDIPLFARRPLVVTVHDVAHLALGAMYGGALRTAYARTMFSAVRRRARHIVFVSRFTADEFTRLVGPPLGVSSVVYNGVDASWRMPSAGSPASDPPYVLAVGSVKPHKNLPALIAAFASIASEIPHDLIVAGAVDGMRTVDRRAFEVPSALTDRVRFVGSAPPDELRRLVSRASMLAFPSLYEGFGLPPLEAMAAGCPCVVSSVGPMPEVCGDAALYCDPRDPADIARRIVELLTRAELRERLVRSGLERASRFDWDESARLTVDALTAAL